MRERIIKHLNEADISAWFIKEEEINSKELFVSKGNMDLFRGKEVIKYTITIYMDYDKYRGDASFYAYSSNTDDTIKAKIEKAKVSALNVKSEYFELSNPIKKDYMNDTPDKMEALNNILDSIGEETSLNAKVNSYEVFVEDGKKTLINSRGLEVSYPFFQETLELITEAGGVNGVEVYSLIKFKDLDGRVVKKTVREKLDEALLRSKATPTPMLRGINVRLRGIYVGDFFRYFIAQCSARLKYLELNTYELGEMLITKDPITLTMLANMEYSPLSCPFDDDGIELRDLILIEDNRYVNMMSSLRYAQYLDIEPTGTLKNFEVVCGNVNEEEEKEPYLEILAFSDFLMDSITGEFGGEIRLANYFDGEKTIPVSGGSFTGVVKEVLPKMRLSEESQEINGFKGPKFILFSDVNVLGKEGE